MRQRFSVLTDALDFETARLDHRWEAAGAGVGPSRSRHRPPSTRIIEITPIPPDERRMAETADTDADEGRSEVEVASGWRPHRRKAQTEAKSRERGVTALGL